MASPSRVAFALHADQRGAALTRLTYSDALSTLVGSGSLSYSTDMQNIEAALTLGSTQSTERYVATFGRVGAVIEGTVGFTAAPVERLAAVPITGDLNGTVLVEGAIRS